MGSSPESIRLPVESAPNVPKGIAGAVEQSRCASGRIDLVRTLHSLLSPSQLAGPWV